MRGGTVVANEANHFGVRVRLRKFQKMFRRSACEGVDGLTCVTHYAQLVALPHPEFEKPFLKRRNVLIFVHGEVPVLAVNFGQNPRVIFQNRHGQEQHVLEVNENAVLLNFLIRGEQARHGLRLQIPHSRPLSRGLEVAVRGQHRDLRPFNFRSDIANERAVSGQSQSARSLSDVRSFVIHQLWQ